MESCIEEQIFTHQIVSLIIFISIISLIISRRLEESHAGLLGISLILILGIMDLYKAFDTYVDWNIIMILLGMWMISYFMSDSGLVDYMVQKILERIRDVRTIVFIMNLLAGIVTMFVDNVLVVLLFVPIMLRIAKLYNIDPVKTSITVALSANFMGTALLLGDLPPQLLHVIFGAEFTDFIWMNNRPSSFIILLTSFIPTIYIVTRVFVKSSEKILMKTLPKKDETYVKKDLEYMIVAALSFIIVIILMSLRKELSLLLGYEIRLGVFPLLIASLFSIILVLKRKTSFEKIVEEGIDLNAILFYISLFILVGSLEETGVLQKFSEMISPMLHQLLIGYIMIYWVSALVVAFVEHDAYILIMLKTIKYMTTQGAISDPWPFNWALLLAGTLGSNFTAAGAPALYVAFRLIERDIVRKILPREIYLATVTYSITSLIICFFISLFIWVLI
ncbi:MAG: anion permease [Desulfurococcales archaeon]|nr:anion permease [Desulfurococcales archaeon]